MNEECIKAQEAISRAADGDRVSAEDAASAKRHCASCPECAVFVSTLVRIKQVGAPQAPEETITRALEAVRRARAEAESTRDALSAAVAASMAGAADAAETPEAIATEAPSGDIVGDDVLDAEPAAPVIPLERARPSTRTVVAWVAGSAALLFVAMIVTAQGLRYISGDGTISQEQSAGDAVLSAPIEPQNDEASGDVPGAAAEIGAAAAQYIEFDGFSYRYVASTTDGLEGAARLGMTRTALDQGGTPVQRSVHEASSDRLILLDAGDRVLTFAQVTRVYSGTTYGLRTDGVEAFGQWPTMPGRIPQPTNPDGGPVFLEADTVSGVTIYVQPGRSAEDGFAVAPGTAVNDPAAGSPEWTWWEPVE